MLCESGLEICCEWLSRQQKLNNRLLTLIICNCVEIILGLFNHI